MLNTLGWVYLLAYAPLTIQIVGVLFLQYILLPFLQYTAFIVILPAAIAMRSFSFAGGGLKAASNALLALAIAGYMIYPLMVMFNSYIMFYLGVNPLTGGAVCTSPPQNACSSLNPDWQYLTASFYPPQVSPNSFFSSPISTPFGVQPPTALVESALSNSNLGLSAFGPLGIVQQSQTIINEMAVLAFQGIFLFAIDLAVTVGFAIGLFKALDAGLEGAGNFWSNL